MQAEKSETADVLSESSPIEKYAQELEWKLMYKEEKERSKEIEEKFRAFEKAHQTTIEEL